MGDVVAAAGDAWNTPFETTSQLNTVRLLLAHTIAAEERMLSFRLQHKEIPLSYDQRAGSSWDELYGDQKKVRAETQVYLAGLTDSEISGDEIVIPMTVFPNALTRADALYQVLNHENYHRGQVITAFQRLGFDPPNFDYILLKGNPRG
jgi:uncharacterized damage-inducible protein DinB